MTPSSSALAGKLRLAVICLLLLAGASMLAGAASGSASAAKLSARLTSKSFTASQAGSVKLVCKLTVPSKHFSYLISRKSGKKWQTVKSVKKTGNFTGSCTTTVKRLFAGKAIKVGSYKLKLTVDSGSKTLSFAVVKAKTGGGGTTTTTTTTPAPTAVVPVNTSLPAISGTAKQGQTLTASNGSWSNTPTGYAYQWRRCDSSGNGCADIAGAGSGTYALVVADADSTIRVVVTASNSHGSASATSSQTAAVSGLVTGVSAGATYTCALLSGGKVECWGANTYGQLGNGTTTDSGTPVVVSGLTNATQVVAGDDHTCALLSDGTVKCWGWNGAGELGTGTAASSEPYELTTPVQVVGSGGIGTTLTGVTQLSAGQSHTCAVRSDNTVWCWGSDWGGELGDGPSGASRSGGAGYRATPVQVVNVGGSSTLAGVTQVSAGPGYSCARLSGGGIDCWGSGNDGELGNGSSGGGYYSPSPVQVSGITSGASEVSAQGDHACAVVSGGVWCWGWGLNGELGNNLASSSAVPVQVLALNGADPLANAAHVSVGSYFSCALLSGGDVDCWGLGYYGELGNGGWDNGAGSDIPVAVTGIATATQLSAGSEHACVFLPDHSIECWGDNSRGQLGNGTFGVDKVPVTVAGAAPVTQLSAGENHTCAVHADGTVWCWGRNIHGQLGDGTTTNRSTPVQVKDSLGTGNLMGVSQVSVGASHTCALVLGSSPPTDNTVWCWGWGGEGELGNGLWSNSSLPVEVYSSGTTPLASVIQVSAGGSDTCAVLSGGTAWCWGYNYYGQLGDGAISPTNKAFPVQVTDVGGSGTLSGVTEVSAGFYHTCAVSAGTVYCWGSGSNGKLGRGSTADSHSPVLTTPITTATEVSAGEYDTCAADGSAAWCWGYNINGALGTGGATPTVPVQVKGAGGTGFLANVADITTGDEHTCARLTDNSVWCWGWGGVGQLGTGSFDTSSYPARVLGTGGSGTLASALPVSAGGEHSCAIRSSDSAVVCWGWDFYGQLGDGAISLAAVPSPVLGLP